jgi:hypothetical protein
MFLKSAFALALLTRVFAADAVPPTAGLTVHEWGTFTSVAGEDGAAVQWAQFTPPSDLPCFVYHLSGQCIKCAANRVRMETPVLYFYSPRPVTVSVHVDLPSGLITEWYPKAARIVPEQQTGRDGGQIDWGPVEVSPGAALEFPTTGSASHYYAARETDSAALRVGDQPEKLLFYRGIANFPVAVEPQFLTDGRLEIRNTGSGSIRLAIVFENHGGQSGYRIIHDLGARSVVDRPELTANVESLHRDLAAALAEAGLYPKEAAAMINTWRDSWFEEGVRVFYLLPQAAVDSVLPLKITPAPAKIARVFVGRVEVLSPQMRQALQTALAAGDTETLSKCGRFLDPFMARVLGQRGGATISPAAQAFIYKARMQAAQSGAAPCRPEPPVLPTVLPTEQQ